MASVEKINFGVIGAGGIAYRKTIPGMLKAKNCRLVAVMDPAGVDRIAAEFGARACATEAELLADPAIQAVYVASPVHCHARQIALAAQAGKHILCEKPLALNSQQAEESVAVCQRAGVFLQEGYMMKFHGAHQAIKQLIDAGRLGKIVSMRAQLSCWYPKIEGAWRQDPAQGGGGALIDMASHLYDLLEYFAGPVRRVAALTGSLVQDYRSEDSSTTLLEFASGAHATVDCFFCVPDEASRTRLEIYGSQGAVLAEGTIGQTRPRIRTSHGTSSRSLSSRSTPTPPSASTSPIASSKASRRNSTARKTPCGSCRSSTRRISPPERVDSCKSRQGGGATLA
jgi:predicted dehydrogenase